MFLAACATEFEVQPLLDLLKAGEGEWMSLVTGVGIMETTLSLARFLEKHHGQVSAVLNFGVGGAYIPSAEGGAALLDICLAEHEVLGDFGICYEDRIESLSEELSSQQSYTLDPDLLDRAGKLLAAKGFSCRQGNFVTVCGVSATAGRGDMLSKQYEAICENMEGAAVARVCAEFRLPLLELRVISNFVEDRDLGRWKLGEACQGAGRAAAVLLEDFIRP